MEYNRRVNIENPLNNNVKDAIFNHLKKVFN